LMFERFTEDARAVVVEAQKYAVTTAAPEIDTLHLLRALLHFPEGEAARLLAGFGVPLQAVAAEADRVRRRGGISEADAEALGELGIDVDQIIARIEQEHGSGALAGSSAKARKRRHIPFAEDSKKTLGLCLREVISLGGRDLGAGHILLALTVLRGPAADVLARFDVDAPRLRQALAS
jgi:ATP-dependent Clp protease ATP-binding subunit ClpA